MIPEGSPVREITFTQSPRAWLANCKCRSVAGTSRGAMEGSPGSAEQHAIEVNDTEQLLKAAGETITPRAVVYFPPTMFIPQIG